MKTFRFERMASKTKREETSSDDEIECPYSGSEALKICKEFAAKTKTDSALAMMILQKNGWDLDRAINAYSQNSKKKRSKTDDQKKNRFKILSWNIDGLDEQQNTLQIRTRSVIGVIQK